MKYYSATIMAGTVFLVTALAGDAFKTSAHVSQETGGVDAFRETVVVKQGVSRDGLFVVSLVPNAPEVPTRIKAANHSRTLRAFMAPNRGGVETIYVESVKPHQFFSVKGKFALLPEYSVLAWTGTTTLSFYGNSPEGVVMYYGADLHGLTLTEESIDTVPMLVHAKQSAIIVP